MPERLIKTENENLMVIEPGFFHVIGGNINCSDSDMFDYQMIKMLQVISESMNPSFVCDLNYIPQDRTIHIENIWTNLEDEFLRARKCDHFFNNSEAENIGAGSNLVSTKSHKVNIANGTLVHNSVFKTEKNSYGNGWSYEGGPGGISIIILKPIRNLIEKSSMRNVNTRFQIRLNTTVDEDDQIVVKTFT